MYTIYICTLYICTHHFTIIFHQGEEDHARLLYHRLPVPVRNHPDMTRLWSVGRATILRDYATVYCAKPSALETLVINSFRARTLKTISIVYRSLPRDQFKKMTGYENAEVDAVATDLGWSLDDGFVYPKKPAVCPSQTNINLSDLSHYISFLENV